MRQTHAIHTPPVNTRMSAGIGISMLALAVLAGYLWMGNRPPPVTPAWNVHHAASLNGACMATRDYGENVYERAISVADLGTYGVLTLGSADWDWDASIQFDTTIRIGAGKLERVTFWSPGGEQLTAKTPSWLITELRGAKDLSVNLPDGSKAVFDMDGRLDIAAALAHCNQSP